MERRQSLFCWLMVALVCSIGYFSSSALAQQKLDQTAIERWRADLRYLAEQLPARHMNLFHTMTREQFEQAVRRLDERIPSLSEQQIFVEMMRIVARVEDAHTSVTLGRRDGFVIRKYPLVLYLYRDGLFVQAAAPEYGRAAGARVSKIGNATVEQAMRVARECVVRDNEMTVKDILPKILTLPEVLFGLGLIEDMENARFIVEKGGEQITLDLKPVPRGTGGKRVDARDHASAPTPLWLKDPRNNYWFEYLADSKTVYVQYNAVGNRRDESVADFFKRVFAFVDDNPVDRFVLDIRRNPGGMNPLNLPIIHGLIRRDKINQPGKLFAIIGRSTNSAAVFLTGDLDEHTHAILVGEPTGGKPNHYGGGRGWHRFLLPHSRLTVYYSNAFNQRGAQDIDGPWFAPQIAAELTSEDYRSNRDPAMEAILNYKPRPPLADTMLEIFLKQGMDAAIRHYREFKTDPMNAYVDTVWQLLQIGRRLRNVHKRLPDAIEILKFNVAEHPRSDLALYLLGGAYERSGDLKQAIECYEKSLALNPRNWDIADHLTSLRGKQGRSGQ